MNPVKLALKTQAQFAELNLEGKNTYLQQVAASIANIQGDEDPTPLSREALTRLRRFYMRRRLSDLALDKTPDPLLRDTLRRYSEALHLGEVEAHVRHETPTSARAEILRAPPVDDDQLSFFVPPTYDAPLKDDHNLMDIAPFSLSKNPQKAGIIRHQLPDCVITIEGGAVTGLITCFDYDIFLHMVTTLTAAMNDYRKAEKRGLHPSLPPRCYRPSTSDILKFIRRGKGGRQYEQMESALDRLQATRIKITNLNHASKRRAAESFPLIGRFKVISRTKNGKIDTLEIEIPEWVYRGVVNPDDKPSVLTLHPDYFLIAKPLARFIYRLARKSAGVSGFSEMGLELLHLRSGSKMPFHKFREALREIAADAKECPLPEFDIAIVPAKTGEKLRMVDRRRKLDHNKEKDGTAAAA
jgi:plasmid replication initiation protein